MAATVSRPAVLDRPAPHHRVVTLPRSPASPARPTRARERELRAQPRALVLTARPLTAARPDVVAALRAARYAVRAAPSWQRLLDIVEAQPVDAVLVDFDAATLDERGHTLEMSGHRLVSLLARRAQVHGFALVLQTSRDYSEIEDLVRQGVHALVHPDDPSARLVASIETARRRRAACRRGACRGEDRAQLADRAAAPTCADVLPTH